MSSYQETIESIQRADHYIGPVKPWHVEATMRSEFGTLDHLPLSKFRAETIELCRAVENPSFVAEIAEAYGEPLTAEAWLDRMADSYGLLPSLAK